MSNSKVVRDEQLNYTINKIKTELGNKVTAVSGKGLSTNDFTNELKTKLDEIDSMSFITTDEIDEICGATITTFDEAVL